MTPTNAKTALRALVALALTAGLAGCGLGAPQPLFTAKGVVRDAAGAGVPGAVVTDGTVSVLTDESGRYAIALFDKHLQVRKPGFAPAALEATGEATDTVALSPLGNGPRVGIDTRWVGDRMTNFLGALKSDGVTLKDYPATALPDLDVLVMVTPGGVSPDELKALRGWVRGGGRLILSGEWGGYPSQDLDLLNSLSEDAGITFTGSTVKLTQGDPDGTEWMSIQGISPASLGKLVGDDALHLYTTTSLTVLAPAQPIFATDKRAYGVLATRTGPQVVGAVGASGMGKVFAVGDSSLWLDEDSGNFGTPNWKRGANLRLAEALMTW
jgi:hypothetical protein